MHPTTITAHPGEPFITVERDFDAPPARVFRAHTDPELVARWLGPRELSIEIAEYDARAGGRYRYTNRDADGNAYRFHGVFHAVEPDERITQTFEYEGAPGHVALETTRFEALDDGRRTRVRTHSVFGSVAERDAMVASDMEHGIRDSDNRLQELLDAQEEAGAAAGLVVADITVSLDGYVTAPGADPQHGLGLDGMVLHDWVFDAKTPEDQQILDASVARSGAVVMGRRTYDVVAGPDGWDDDLGYGGGPEGERRPPVFVLTHRAPDTAPAPGSRFRFVTDGPESALKQARAAAGGKDVVIMGGGATVQEFLAAGLVDELTLHLAPLVLGGGTPLFPPGADTPRIRLTVVSHLATPGAHHLTYRVRRG